MSKNKTADSAERKASKMLGYSGRGKKIAVYQFPAGHWDLSTGPIDIRPRMSAGKSVTVRDNM
jgi:hypothetical protein